MAVTLARHKLQDSRTDAIAYGAKDTGEMGGGAAGAVLLAAGTRLSEVVKVALATTSRQVGSVVITDSFDLAPRVKWICHIVSIIKNTPQGAWCPQPERLADGVREALRLATERGALSVTMSALGTGEGRVSPEHAARLMVGAAREYLRQHRDSPLDVEFALPNFRDYEAFAKALKA